MIQLWAALVLAQTPVPQAPAPQVYTDKKLGLSFSHPADWVLQKPAKPPKRKKGQKGDTTGDVVTFKIPSSSGNVQSELTIVRASFSGSTSEWQQLQVDANKNLKREVERQYEQQFLGVPLLLTRIAYSDNDGPKTTLVGLLYSNTALKFLFRLTSATTDFEKSEFQFNQTMESLRTLTDVLPSEQKAGQEAPPAPGSVPEKPRQEIKERTRPTRLVISPRTVEIGVGKQRAKLHVPQGWTATVADSVVRLSHGSVREPLSFRLLWVGEADTPATNLSKVVMDQLNGFTVVDLREDVPTKVNKAGASVSAVYRMGQDAKGPIATIMATVAGKDLFLLGGGALKTGPAYKTDRRLIDQLLNGLSLEPLP